MTLYNVALGRKPEALSPDPEVRPSPASLYRLDARVCCMLCRQLRATSLELSTHEECRRLKQGWLVQHEFRCSRTGD